MQAAVIAYKDKLLLFDGKKFQSLEDAKVKHYKVGCRIPATYVRFLSFKLPINLSQEQLAIQVELKMYNEGGLDPNQEYMIDYIPYKLEQEKSYLIEAFALSKDDLDTHIGNLFKKIGFIDVVYPKFITYKALYSSAIKSTDLILFLGEKEAFCAFFQNGRFIGHRSIDSLASIAQKVGIELVKLKTLLATKGLIAHNYLPEEKHIFDALQEVMFSNVEKIIYALNFKRGFFSIERIDRLLIDFEGEMVAGLKELFLSFALEGELRYEKISCCNMDAKEASLAIEALYVARYEELDQRLNFTFYERKKPLYTYNIVHFTVVLLLFLGFLAGGYFYLFGQSIQLQERITKKEQLLDKLKRENSRYLLAIKKLKQQKASLQNEKKLLENEIELYQDTLDTIPFIQNAKLQREQMMNDVIEALFKFHLSTKAIEQNGTKYTFVDLLSKEDEREKIAKFIRYLLEKNYTHIQTDGIIYNKGVYFSRIKVAR